VTTDSKIEWTGPTWNPITGCDQVSTGCDNCYAMKLAKRLKAMGSAKYQNDGDPRTSGPGFGVTVHPAAMLDPLRWKKPSLVFVNSMSDVAHGRVPRSAVVLMWAVMALAGRHQFQVLTKRPRRLARMLANPTFLADVAAKASEIMASRPWQRWQLDLGGQRVAADSGRGGGWTVTPTGDSGNLWTPPWPLPNVWLGVSIENDDYCWRADQLRRAPAAVRFLSCEPLLGPLHSLDLAGIDWVIVGGESGDKDVRAMDQEWAGELVRRCGSIGVPLFAKQLGTVLARELGLRHDKGGDPAEWPWTWPREFPPAAQLALAGTGRVAG